MRKVEWSQVKEATNQQLAASQCVEVQVNGTTKGFLIILPPDELYRPIRMICQQVDATRSVGKFQDKQEPISKIVFITEVPFGDIN